MQHQQDHMHDNLSWDEPSTGQPVERWDDDDFANLDDIQFRAASTASSAASWQHNQPGHNDRRDSLFSRLSARSDRGSNQDDQDWDVVVDQSSLNDAVAIAKRTGIPIPTNVPQSALVGGTIRKMPGKKIKQAMSEDWTEDLDFDGPLKLRSTSASKTQPGLDSDEFDDGFELSSEGCLQPHQASGKFQLPLSSPMPPRTEGFGDGFGLSYQGHPKLRRSPGKMQIPSRSAKADTDDFEADFELPSDG